MVTREILDAFWQRVVERQKNSYNQTYEQENQN